VGICHVAVKFPVLPLHVMFTVGVAAPLLMANESAVVPVNAVPTAVSKAPLVASKLVNAKAMPGIAAACLRTGYNI
jgi:hypothetical protein